jgi:hypothetical protein
MALSSEFLKILASLSIVSAYHMKIILVEELAGAQYESFGGR